MAIDLNTENSSLTTSPRISFSHDLRQTDDPSTIEDQLYRLDSTLLDSNSDDFDFCISNSIEAETTSAEELFLGGLIRPLQLQERFVHTSKPVVSVSKSQAQNQIPSLPPLPFPPPSNGGSKPEILKEKETTLANIETEQKNQSKSFWSIKRSSSLHSHKKSSFWSLPLLSRSNSTGSVPNSKQGLKENQKQNSHPKQHKNLNGMSVSATGAASFYVYPMSQKPPLRKNYLGSSNANGLRISPVIHMPVPSSHISKGTANLLGLGSLFRNGRDKKIKK